MAGFGATVGSWSEKALTDMHAVFQHAVVLLARELARPEGDGGGTLPHLTGNLMRSLVAQIGSMPLQGGPDERYGGSDVGAVVATALLDSDIFLGFQANYARRMNYGFQGQDSLGRTYDQAGRLFVERAVAMWPQIVKQAVAEVKGA